MIARIALGLVVLMVVPGAPPPTVDLQTQTRDRPSAAVVGTASLGGSLVTAALLTDESTAQLTARARALVERVAQARRQAGHAR